jgi:EcsC protein family
VADRLTGYEAWQVEEIAAWKAEEPGRISRLLEAIRAPLGRIVGTLVPGSIVRAMAEESESIVEHDDSLREIAAAAGIDDIAELRSGALEDCDRLAAAVSVRAQRLAMLEGAAAGVGTVVTEALNMPLLLAAAERAIRRIGHCYGYRLDTDEDRRLVLEILELSTVPDPVVRRQYQGRLERQLADRSAGAAFPIGLNGVKEDLVDDLILEAVPVLGDLVSIALDYAFMRRVDVTARRVFQESWLRDRGKVSKIFPASAGPRSSTILVARELLAETVYLGGYSLGFALTAPAALAGRLASYLPGPIVHGAVEGAHDAVEAVDQISQGWQSLSEPAGPEPRIAESLV